MLVTRNNPKLNYSRSIAKAQPVHKLHWLTPSVGSEAMIMVLCMVALFAAYLLASHLFLREFHTFNGFYAAKLWISLWRDMANSVAVVLHYYMSLLLKLAFSVYAITSF